MDKEKLLEFYISHQGGINGATIGLITSVIILLIGFLDTLFIAICVGIGYYIGKRFYEDKEFIKNIIDRVLPPGTYR